MSTYVVLICSVNEPSSGRRYVPIVEAALQRGGGDVVVHDVRNMEPFWMGPGGVSRAPSGYATIASDIRNAQGVVMILPIYCYTTSSVAKCLSEILNEGLTFKPVIFIVSAGTDRSYLAIRDLMSSLVFEQNTLCYPRIVFDSTGGSSEILPQNKIRCETLIGEFIEFCIALAPFVEKRNLADD